MYYWISIQHYVSVVFYSTILTKCFTWLLVVLKRFINNKLNQKVIYVEMFFFSLLPLFAKMMCLMPAERLWAWLVRNRPQLTGRCCRVTSRIISVCRITPPWTVTLSDLSLCNSPACPSQVHCISRCTGHERVTSTSMGDKSKRGRHGEGKEEKWQNINGRSLCMVSTRVCYYWIRHRGQRRGDVRVRRGGGLAAFPWLSIANVGFTFYGSEWSCE